jgi:hypothetical protein
VANPLDVNFSVDMSAYSDALHYISGEMLNFRSRIDNTLNIEEYALIFDAFDTDEERSAAIALVKDLKKLLKENL